MTLRFKGNKTASDVIQLTKEKKAAGSMLQKRKHEELQQQLAEKKQPGQFINQQKQQQQQQQQQKEQYEDEKEIIVTQEIKKTRAQIGYEIIQKKRQQNRIEQKLKESHIQRLDNFNKNLSILPEHFDIPKVGPG